MTTIDIPVIERADDSGQTVIRLGLGFTLYFVNGHLRSTRDAVADCVRLFHQNWSCQMRWSAFEGSRFRRTDTNYLVRIIDYLASSERENAANYWAFTAHDGESEAEAPLCSVFALGQPREDSEANGDISFVSFGVPYEAGAAAVGRLADVMLACCQRIRPLHGYGGLRFVQAADDGLAAANVNALYGLAQRYAGVDVDFPLDHCLYLKDAVKGANWLVALPETWARDLDDELGSTSLPISCETLRFERGRLIKAGEVPELGDRNRHQSTPQLNALAAYLRPIRVKFHGEVGESFESKFDSEVFSAWLARFG